MIKTILAAATSAAALTAAASAQDSGVVYLEVGLGAAFAVQDDLTREGTYTYGDFFETWDITQSIDLSTGAAFRLLAGYEVTPNISVEIEAQANAAEIDDGDTGLVVGAQTLNVVYSGSKDGNFIPYAGVGIGYASPSLFDEDGDEIEVDVDGAFAYQVKAGVLKPVGVHHNFGVEFRYLGAGDFKEEISNASVQGEERLSYGALAATISYRYRFGTR